VLNAGKIAFTSGDSKGMYDAASVHSREILSSTALWYKVFYTVVPPYPLIYYPRFTAARKKIEKPKK
jgi:hypothetical protein